MWETEFSIPQEQAEKRSGCLKPGNSFLSVGRAAETFPLRHQPVSYTHLKWNDNATMWGVLVGILGLIPGIIYLCVRNEPLKRIYVCHNLSLIHI